MDDGTEPTAWQETTGVVARPATGQLSTPSLALSGALSTDVAPTGDTPDNRRAFAAAIGPCLALTAPSGMGEAERRAWLQAAFAALNHLPLDLIEKGAAEARRTADHPSKIVPAIIAATEREVAWRRRNQHPRSPGDLHSTLPAPGQEIATPDEVEAICKQFAVGRYATVQPQRNAARSVAQPAHADPDRPCRVPTREDYLRMGVAPEVLDRLAAPASDEQPNARDQLAA